MTVSLVFAATLTAQGRPVEIGARLYGGDRSAPLAEIRCIPKPVNWTLDAAPKVAKRAGDAGIPFSTILPMLRDMSACADDFVLWDREATRRLLNFCATVANFKETIARPAGQRIIDLQSAAASLLRGERDEAWLPTLDDAREFLGFAAPVSGLPGILDDLSLIRERLAGEGLLS